MKAAPHALVLYGNHNGQRPENCSAAAPALFYWAAGTQIPRPRGSRPASRFPSPALWATLSHSSKHPSAPGLLSERGGHQPSRLPAGPGTRRHLLPAGPCSGCPQGPCSGCSQGPCSGTAHAAGTRGTGGKSLSQPAQRLGRRLGARPGGGRQIRSEPSGSPGLRLSLPQHRPLVTPWHGSVTQLPALSSAMRAGPLPSRWLTFRSRCTMPISCRYRTASRICRISWLASRSV